MIPHTFTASDGLKLAYYVDDNTDPWADAPTLLMLHAAMGNAQRFYAWVPMLSRHYRVVRLDLRGHGNSATPAADSTFDMGRLVSDTLELMDLLGCKSAHVVGNSAGGYIGQNLAMAHPATGEEPDPVRLDAGPAQQPGRELDPEDRQGRHTASS